jgi:predicted DNA-binding transcriptional regulator AlpA
LKNTITYHNKTFGNPLRFSRILSYMGRDGTGEGVELEDDDCLITLKEAAAITGVSKTQIYERQKTGLFPKLIKDGKRTRFSKRECHEYVRQQIPVRESHDGTMVLRCM